MILDDAADEDHIVCKDTNCAILPIGFALLAVDSYYDLRWVLRPSPTTAQELRRYYTFLLAPRWQPIPHPGFLFPFYCIYKLCVECPTIFNHWLLALFVPISCRYVGILNLYKQEQLQHWWTVVVLRVGLAVVNTLALQAYGDCAWQHTTAFLFGRS